MDECRLQQGGYFRQLSEAMKGKAGMSGEKVPDSAIPCANPPKIAGYRRWRP
jgi:hypothetical protein